LPLDALKVLAHVNNAPSYSRPQPTTQAQLGVLVRDWLTLKMVREFHTFMALIFYRGEWWVRLSAQVYLELDDFEWGAVVLKELCERVRQGAWLEE